MAIGDKPTDLPQWADGGSAQITEPSAGKKLLGWIKEKPSFAFFNWFWNLVYQWLGWAKKYGEEHVHDGGATDWSAPKVDLLSHIDYGDNGELEVITDTDPGIHEIDHRYIGATGSAKFNTDILGVGFIRFGKTTGEQFDLQDGSGLPDARQAEFLGISGDTCGVKTEAYLVTRNNSPGGNFGALFPEDSSLYRKNLNKVVGKFNFTESLGTINNSQVSRYNIPGNWVTGGAPAGTFVLNLSSGVNVDGVVLASVSVNQAGSDTNDYRIDMDWDSVNERLVLTIHYFDNTSNTWFNARVSGPPTGMDIMVNFTVL